MSFKNKIVWITGASSGIGEALAIALKKEGAKLILSSRKREKLYELKQKLKANPIDTHILQLDLEDKQNLPDKAEEAWKIYGKIDYLFNCGGVSQRSTAVDTSIEAEEKIMNTNYWGTVILSKALLPKMIDAGEGHLVVISSLVGKFGTAKRSSYSASKHALHGYFDSLRSEVFDKGIDISIICPGYIHTAISKNAVTGDGSLYQKMDKNQEKGISARECASQILAAVKAKKEEVVIAGKEKYGVLWKRFFPAYFSKMIRKREIN
jgi:dehydrogenase/reductase SDR family protein 7B